MHTPDSGNFLTFRCVYFESLDARTLYEVLRLRQEIFCVEQNCAYLDADGEDQLAWHVLGYKGGELVATARLLMPGISSDDACAIGRVAAKPEVRGSGVGKALMQNAIDQCEALFPGHPIKISAQQYLIRFYRSLGFIEQGEGYLEDGIPHIEMKLA